MPSSATSSLFIIDEGHWALARGSLGDAFQSWWPAVHWSLSPALRLCPSSQLILQTVFWQLKRHLGSDRDSFYTHTSTSPLSVPLLSSHESPNAFRMWEMATHRGENECLSQEETIWNALRGRMMGVGDTDFFSSFSISAISKISLWKSLEIVGTEFGKMTALQFSWYLENFKWNLENVASVSHRCIKTSRRDCDMYNPL